MSVTSYHPLDFTMRKASSQFQVGSVGLEKKNLLHQFLQSQIHFGADIR